MKQSEIDAAVAESLGESRRIVAERGFDLLREELTESERVDTPNVIDWDELELQRLTVCVI